MFFNGETTCLLTFVLGKGIQQSGRVHHTALFLDVADDVLIFDGGAGNAGKVFDVCRGQRAPGLVDVFFGVFA